MGVAVEGFKVVTEFVFNADRALGVAESLNKQVDKLSHAADEAVHSVARLGMSYAMSFSGATGGILGILGNAIKSSDKFKGTQIELANTMVANQMKISGSVIAFNEALLQSDLIMGKIVKKSREFGLSPDAFTSQVKFFNNMLAPKGLAGTNLSESIEIARVSMKAAPALGVSNEQAISGILSGISGQLSRNTQFGTRLFMESGEAIESQTGIKNLKEFNKAKPEKRIRALIVGLDKLAGSADAVNARADTLGSRLMQIRDLFAGVGSILKPLGDVILPTIKQTLDIVITFLKNEGAIIVKEMATFIKGFMDSPKKMLLDLMQLRDLSKDLGTSIAIGGMALTIAHLSELVEFLSNTEMTAKLGKGLLSIGNFVKKIPILGESLSGIFSSFHKMFSLELSSGFLVAVKSIGMAMPRMAGFVGVLLIPLQGLSRALNSTQVEAISKGIKLIPEFMKGLNKLWTTFKVFLTPFQDMIEGWEQFFRMFISNGKGTLGILGTVRALWNVFFGDLASKTEGLAGLALTYGKSIASFTDTISNIGTAFLSLWGTLKGIVAGIAAVIGTISGAGNRNLISAALSGGGLSGIFKEAMQNEFAKTLDKARTPTLGPDGVAEKTVTNYVNQDIKMNNNFKEVLQPDRIAFTIEKQLEKAARNRKGVGRTNFAGIEGKGF